MKKICIIFLALLALPVFAVSADLERGGVSFDFESISAERFAVEESRNMVKEPVSGVVTGSFEKVFHLPKTDAATWRVSLRYRMRHAKAGASLFKVVPGPWRPVKIQECGRDWGMLSVVTEVPAGTGSLKTVFTFAPDSEVEFEYKDFSIVDVTPQTSVVLKQMPMGNLDGRFAVSAGQCGMVEHYWRKTVQDEIDYRKVSFSLELPPCVEFVGANFARSGSVKTVVCEDGSSVTTFLCSKLFVPQKTFDTHTALAFVVKAKGRVGESGHGRLTVKYSGKNPFEVDSKELRYFIIDAVKAQKPKRFCTGIMPGHMLNHLDRKTMEGMSHIITDSGVTWMAAKGSQETYSLWRSLGVRRITPSAQNFCNGYQVGILGRMPKSDRYVARGVDPKSRFAARIGRAACPVSIYEGSDFFRTNTVPYIQGYVKGADGCWSNWEPMMFTGKGCMCDRCCRKFAGYIGKPYAEISAEWPHNVMKGGRYHEAAVRFRSLEHAKVVRAVDRVVREATGGDSSLGLIPGVAWIEMSSWWRPRNYVAEMLTVDYAGSLRWMNPWGPYVAWESDSPYIYAKRKPMCHFFAAQDILKTVISDHGSSHPKLMALPQGYQCGNWLSQPEHIAMALDSYFFNGWDSAVLYYFPRGYDARYWKAFADATTRAAKYEDYVLDGTRCDSKSCVAPLDGVYASPVRLLSGYLSDCRNISPLQCVSYDYNGKRMVAVFNFWDKGEAFFNLKVKGLAAGRYEVVREDGKVRAPSLNVRHYSAQTLSSGGVRLSVGAARMCVFMIQPCEGGQAGVIETDDDFESRLKTRSGELRRLSIEDAKMEEANGEIPCDSMPVI